jgi:hypothetical protein
MHGIGLCYGPPYKHEPRDVPRCGALETCASVVAKQRPVTRTRQRDIAAKANFQLQRLRRAIAPSMPSHARPAPKKPIAAATPAERTIVSKTAREASFSLNFPRIRALLRRLKKISYFPHTKQNRILNRVK